ncbi:MAG TPA: hypothetical protein VH540_23390, partial [Ktedonobacterales bacterium]
MSPRNRFLALIGTLAVVAALTVTISASGAALAAPVTSNASPMSFSHACGSAGVGFARCFAIQRTGGAGVNFQSSAVSPNVTNCSHPASGYTPCDLQSAYKLPSSSATPTVAIVDAF